MRCSDIGALMGRGWILFTSGADSEASRSEGAHLFTPLELTLAHILVALSPHLLCSAVRYTLSPVYPKPPARAQAISTEGLCLIAVAEGLGRVRDAPGSGTS